MEQWMLEMKDVSKSYLGEPVLRGVNLQIKSGDIHALVGENGAGKTTIVKILLGLEELDEGQIYMDGNVIHHRNPVQSRDSGIHAIFQEVNLVSSLSILENIYLGSYSRHKYKWFSIINWSKAESEVTGILNLLRLSVRLHAKISNLSLLQKKIVEIAKALCSGTRMLILDEATADLDEQESEEFIRIIRQLSASGITVIFISHKLNEVMKTADTISVIRKGVIVETSHVRDSNVQSIIENMTKHTVTDPYPKIRVPQFGPEVLKVEGLRDQRTLNHISFQVRRKEIVGLTGFADSGKSEVARAIFGLNRAQGKIYVNRKELSHHSPSQSIKHRIGYIPGDRSESLIHCHGIHRNISLSNLKTVSRMGFIDLDLEKKVSLDYVKRLGIRATSVEQEVEQLSGGNRQKVMIAKNLLTRASIHIFDEPTKGLDITSKVELYNIMNEIILHDGAILFISSNLEELLGMCDRILILYHGEIVKELSGAAMNEQNIVYYASGEK